MNALTRTVIVSTLFITGCGMQQNQEQIMQTPGYTEAKRFCSKCHELPSGEQHHPAAWASVIHRMEGYLTKVKRKLPTDQERKEILGFFQATSKK